jgi:putative endonuclease
MFYVYIMTNRTRTVLHTGVTNNLECRAWQHVNSGTASFTKRYSINRIVYYETFSDIRSAIAHEKQIKGWRREKKIALIQSENPRWEDLGKKMFGRQPS